MDVIFRERKPFGLVSAGGVFFLGFWQIKLVCFLKRLIKSRSELDVLLVLACVQCRLGLLIVSQ